APLPYKGMGVSKPLSVSGRGLERGFCYTLRLFKQPLRHCYCAIAYLGHFNKQKIKVGNTHLISYLILKT
ncbi:hypothetical protein, partial [Nostoc sp. CALU 1950]|uniref:hypothetical protein n=1 Tax=Nostoc sp. CALU 1950 TaxID=3104321 RepID=UPI003EB9190F